MSTKVWAQVKIGPRRDKDRYQHIATAEIHSIGNQHPYFSITVDTWMPQNQTLTQNGICACGCQHDVVQELFPELVKYLKWHLTSTGGPMHYIANTVYHAGNRDYNGRVSGEPATYGQGIKVGNSPISHQVKRSFWEFLQSRRPITDTTPFVVAEIAHKKDFTNYNFSPKYTFDGYGTEWHHCPFDSKAEAEEWATAMNDRELSVQFIEFPTSFSKGKVREFEAARNCAVWPEATDEELSLPKEELTKLLEARHPKLMEEFQKDMLELFGTDTWSAWKPKVVEVSKCQE